MRSKDLKERWTQFAASKRGQWVFRGARAALALGIFGYLVYALRDVGWAEVVAGLPTDPLFYLLFYLLYFSLPVAELFVYRITWVFDLWKSFPAFIKKHLNTNLPTESSSFINR